MSAGLHDETVTVTPPSSGVLFRLGRLAEIVPAVMFALVFLIFLYKIVTRYLGHHEAVWADEVSVILFIWIIFWANTFVVREREHITFDLVYRPLPARWKRKVAFARFLLIGGVFAWALPGSLDYIAFLWRERTPVLEWRLDWVYACFGLFLVSVVFRAARQLVGLSGRRWRSFV